MKNLRDFIKMRNLSYDKFFLLQNNNKKLEG